MESFTESQIQGMIDELKDEFGPEIVTRELALLELEDMKRKGCALEYACKFDQCHGCSMSSNCPVIGWEKRHPEYANDELAMKIKVLEAGGEEAYKKKLEAIEAAKKKKLIATNEDKVDAAQHVLNLYLKSKSGKSDNDILNLNAINEILNATTKSSIQDILKNFVIHS